MSDQGPPPQYPPSGGPPPPPPNPLQYPPPQEYPPPPAFAPPPVSLVGPGGTERADFGPRAVAYLIDAAIVGGGSLIVIIILGILTAVLPEAIRGVMVLVGLLAYLGMLLVGVCYQPYFWIKTGQTMGQKVMNIKVLDAGSGSLISAGNAVVRYLILAITGGFCFLLLLWPLWDPLKEALHDKVAKSVVVRA